MNGYPVSSDSFSLVFHAADGTLLQLSDPSDPHGTNWIDPRMEWGKPDSFSFERMERTDQGSIAHFRNTQQKLRLTVTRTLSGRHYVEKYEFENCGSADFYMTRENTGIHFPYNCYLGKRPDLLNDCVLSHLWCGGDLSWIISCKPNGEPGYLVCMVTEGAFQDYSQEYRHPEYAASAYYRGAFILHPCDCVIPPEGKKCFTFVYTFSKERPDETFLPQTGQSMFVHADKYTLISGESASCFFESAFPWESAEIEADGKSLPYRKEGRRAFWSCSFEKKGEHRLVIYAARRSTWMDFYVTDRADVILERRTAFICEKQQFHEAGNPLDGALLIYDRITGKTDYDPVFRDSNAGRERLAMGIIAAVDLQRRKRVSVSQTLKKYRSFLERELLDPESGTVYEDTGRKSDRRAYNYPWMADFYLELYSAENDMTCLKTAARILLRYYAMIAESCQDSPCLEDLRVLQELERAGETGLAALLKKAILDHCDELIRRGNEMYSEEVSYTQAQFYMKIISLCHAWLLTGDQKYLNPVPRYLRCVEAFSAQQPSYRANLLGIRWWDMFWFGKSKSYGDTMPQWLCACCGEMYFLLAGILHDPEMQRRGIALLRNCLCVYDDTGFGSAGYLMPYKVFVEYPADHKLTICDMKESHSGKHYDDWANDQDFTLYYAALRNI